MGNRIFIPGTGGKSIAEPMLATMPDKELLSFMELSNDPFVQHLAARLDGSFRPSNLGGNYREGRHWLRPLLQNGGTETGRINCKQPNQGGSLWK